MKSSSSTAGRVLRAICATIAAPLFLAVASVAGAQTQSASYDLDIPSQDLHSALQQLAVASHHKLLYKTALVAGKTSSPIKGTFTAQEAIQQVLLGTNLTFEITSESVVLIKDGSLANTGDNRAGSTVRPAALSGSNQSLLARADTQSGRPDAGQTSDAQADKAAAADESRFEEIIVTAQKRSERLQDVPVPVTAVNANALVDSGLFRLQDYYSRIPGLSFTPGPRGEPVLAIRGVSTDPFTNPTVSTLVDDVPYGSSTVIGGGSTVPDIDPSELARIEVLRGPQGTLYGASSIGGLIKFVTVDPSTERFSGRVQGMVNSVKNGDEIGYGVRGAVNVPLGETAAVRASGFTRLEPGYIDDVGLGIDGVNRAEAKGGRLAALWRPSDVFTVKLSAQINDSTADGTSQISLLSGFGDLQNANLQDTGTYERKSEIYSATLSLKLGRAELTSLTGYNKDTFYATRDFTAAFGSRSMAAYGVPGASLIDDRKGKKFSQEIRLSAPLGSKLDSLVGVFYTDEKTDYFNKLLAVNPATGVVAGFVPLSANGGPASFPSEFKERAVFADLTYHMTDRFQVQFGGRQSRVEPALDFSANQAAQSAQANAFTYLVSPQFNITPDVMAYARLASGYRAGGTNTNAFNLPEVPAQYEPDKTRNYEIGFKGNLFGRALFLDASVYYIDWSNIQINLITPQLQGYRVNGGQAKSQGVEVSLEARPIESLTIATWVAWSDAELTEDLPATSSVRAFEGDRLPNSSRFSGNLSVDQQFPLTSRITGFWGGTVSYIGDRKGVFLGNPAQRQSFPAYAKTDLRAGVKYETWAVNLFANNITDRRGVLTGNFIGTAPYVNYITPRSIGLSVSKDF